MKSEKELQAARHHLTQAVKGAASEGDLETADSIATMLDIIAWVLGERSMFAKVLADCDKVDAAGRN